MRSLCKNVKISSVLSIALIFLITTSTIASAQSKKIVVYSAIEEGVTTRVLREFTTQTGIPTEMLSLAAAGTLAARIRAEKDRPMADIFMGGSADIHAPLAREGLLLAYKSPVAAEARIRKEFLDPDGFWHGWYTGALSIIVNKDRFERELAPKGVLMPKAWDDLIHPAFKGHFVMPSPVTTGGGFIFLATQIFRLGEDRAWEYLKSISANALHFTPTAPATITMLERGEAIVGMNWGHEGLVSRGRGVPLEVIFPPDTGFEIGSVSIVKGGPNPEGAKAFVDFLMTTVPQDINATFGLRYPVRVDAKSPAGTPPFATIKFVKYDRAWAIENMTRIRDRWTKEIGR